MVLINRPACGTSDCKNLIQMTAVKYEEKMVDNWKDYSGDGFRDERW